jgi:hypothetical protein
LLFLFFSFDTIKKSKEKNKKEKFKIQEDIYLFFKLMVKDQNDK